MLRGLAADERGGNPGIMSPRGTIVDSQFQWNPRARVTNAGRNAVRMEFGASLNPARRTVTQGDINGLNLPSVFRQNNMRKKVSVGNARNTMH